MRTTSRGHSIDLGDCLPYRSHSNSWDSFIAYGNHEGAGKLTEDEHPASSSATRTPFSYRKPINAPVATEPTYQSAGPWLGEGDTNIWAHGMAPQQYEHRFLSTVADKILNVGLSAVWRTCRRLSTVSSGLLFFRACLQLPKPLSSIAEGLMIRLE